MSELKVFLSYAFPDEEFVARVNHYLLTQPGLDSFFWGEDRRGGGFVKQLRKAIDESDGFVLVLGEELGETQGQEAFHAADKEIRILVELPGQAPAQRDAVHWEPIDPIKVEAKNEAGAESCAKEIVRLLGRKWIPWDEVPERYVFDYEKVVIKAYTGEQVLDPACPECWPSVFRDTEAWRENPVSPVVIGDFLDGETEILVDARGALQPEDFNDARSNGRPLTFLEARPRAKLSFPRRQTTSLTVGILVSGGIAPGINAVIEGIVSRHTSYSEAGAYAVNILGYLEGFRALLRSGATHKKLTLKQVRGAAHDGGSILGTSRADELHDSDPGKRWDYMSKALKRLDVDGVEILYVIGGDGSMRAAHAIWKAAQLNNQKLSVVGIPKTMDNDVLWVWQAFGFLSAVDRAREAIYHLSTEIRANPRLCVIQLFGSDSGFVVSHAALASGAGFCDLALIPEMPFSMAGISRYLLPKLEARYKPGEDGARPYGMVVMAETAIPTDVEQYLEDGYVGLDDEEKDAIRAFVRDDRRVRGQTPDALRTGGLKVVSRVLQRNIRAIGDRHDYWESFRVFTNEPRHLLRAIPPSVADIVIAQRLGALAADNAMAGYSDFMISQWLTEYVLVPLRLVVLGRKRLPLDGIFWKSVLSMTEQPADLDGE